MRRTLVQNFNLLENCSLMLTPSLPRALITPKLGYPLISICSNRESLGNPRESP